MKKNKIYEFNICGIIGETGNEQENNFSYDDLAGIIRYIKNDNSIEELVINIRSTGGNVNDALLIYDDLLSLDLKITTRCYGYVASAATIIAQAATEGRREISRNAMYLIHRSSTISEGNHSELNRTIDLLEKTDERIAEIYAHRSGSEIQSFLEIMDKNNGKGEWMTARECVETGLADKITGAEKIKNSALKELKILNLPQLPENDKTALSVIKNIKKLLAKINYMDGNEYSRKLTEIETKLETMEEKAKRTELLENKIRELEKINKRISIQPTKTSPKEDPSHRDLNNFGNNRSYENDMKNFKY
ncbi:MAG: ATP-dependent Clp protease proteolytic subunit [Rikenellaceae bacterium]|nr:ATP-dependent Clp protease proteolytic subunit [Rikenellaceae bacterium]